MTTVEQRAGIRPFRTEVPEEALADIRRRIVATRWPSRELADVRSHAIHPRRVAYVNEVERGGHVAAWEEPELLSAEVRATFRPLRTPEIPEPRR